MNAGEFHLGREETTEQTNHGLHLAASLESNHHVRPAHFHLVVLESLSGNAGHRAGGIDDDEISLLASHRYQCRGRQYFLKDETFRRDRPDKSQVVGMAEVLHVLAGPHPFQADTSRGSDHRLANIRVDVRGRPFRFDPGSQQLASQGGLPGVGSPDQHDDVCLSDEPFHEDVVQVVIHGQDGTEYWSNIGRREQPGTGRCWGSANAAALRIRFKGAVMNGALWIVAAILTVVFFVAGMMKTARPHEELAASMNWAEDFTPSTVTLIGGLEMLGAIGLVLPPLLGVTPILAPNRSGSHPAYPLAL